jgi:hypothetical protein
MNGPNRLTGSLREGTVSEYQTSLLDLPWTVRIHSYGVLSPTTTGQVTFGLLRLEDDA